MPTWQVAGLVAAGLASQITIPAPDAVAVGTAVATSDFFNDSLAKKLVVGLATEVFAKLIVGQGGLAADERKASRQISLRASIRVSLLINSY